MKIADYLRETQEKNILLPKKFADRDIGGVPGCYYFSAPWAVRF